MRMTESQNWLNDIDEILAAYPDFRSLSGKSVLVTGASGLICSAVCDILLRMSETLPEPVTVIAAGRSEEKMRARFSRYADQPYFRYLAYDANDTVFAPDLKADFLIHGASNAYPARVIREPVETMLSNFTGMYALLSYARSAGTQRVLYISSSEVYGKKEGNHPYKENEYGYVDLLSPRSSYAVGKRAAETLCASFYDEYGVDAVIIRPGHIYGPTASKADNRVSSAWPYAVARGEDLVMKSDGSQLRSYCHCLDTASAILTALLTGETMHPYNISDPACVISIRDMGELLAKAGGVRLIREEPTELEKKAFNPMSNSSLDGTHLSALGWKALFTPERGFAHTIAVLKELM